MKKISLIFLLNFQPIILLKAPSNMELLPTIQEETQDEIDLDIFNTFETNFIKLYDSLLIDHAMEHEKNLFSLKAPLELDFFGFRSKKANPTMYDFLDFAEHNQLLVLQKIQELKMDKPSERNNYLLILVSGMYEIIYMRNFVHFLEQCFLDLQDSTFTFEQYRNIFAELKRKLPLLKYMVEQGPKKDFLNLKYPYNNAALFKSEVFKKEYPHYCDPLKQAFVKNHVAKEYANYTDLIGKLEASLENFLP